MRILGIIASVQKGFSTFFDTFTSGFISGWSSVRSGWTAASGTATASTTDYPISVVTMSKENVTSQIVNDTANSGAGISLWVQDSNNWFGVASKQTDTYSTYYYNCSCTPYSYSCNCVTSFSSCNCVTNGPFAAGCTTSGPYLGYLAINNTYYYYYTDSCSYYYYTQTCDTCSTQTCQTCTGYSCSTCAGTSTTNNYYLKLYRSVAGTVSELTSVTLSAVAKSIRVITNGLGITGRAYSDNNFASQTGSDLTYTATGATTSKLHGILVAPSTQNQSTTIDSFQSTTN
jgi:hypothetical protein